MSGGGSGGAQQGGRGGAQALTDRVKALARGLGFDAVGVAPAEPPPHAEFLPHWVERGYAGEMGWLARRTEVRADPRRVLPGAASVIAVSLLYATGADDVEQPAGEPTGRVARYARGDDYHDVLGARLHALADALAPLAGRPVRARAYVDTGPVLERGHAARAGLGWIGKNTLLIDPERGSYLFLGVVVTDLALVPDEPEPDHCGTCRACLDACPTDAFVEPYVLDASRCLSYTTIEARGPTPEPLRAPQGDWVFGCDVCQEVCPWNASRPRRAPSDPLGLRARLAPRGGAPSLRELLEQGEGAWREATRRSPLRRARHRGMVRNALVAAGNAGDPALGAAVETHAAGDDALLAEVARWARARLRGRGDQDEAGTAGRRASRRARWKGRGSAKQPSS